MTTILWFRQDLRVTDHAALLDACSRGQVVPLFIWDQSHEGEWPMGGAQRWWLDGSLRNLEAELRARGSRLIVRIGETNRELLAVAKECGATRVNATRRYEPAAMIHEEKLRDVLEASGVSLNCLGSNLLFDPFTIRSQTGTPYKVFTPFWRNCLAQTAPELPKAAPKSIQSPAKWPASVAIETLKLLPTIKWESGLQEEWTPGESAARKRLALFLDGPVGEYSVGRDIPSTRGTSMLSAYLHFGELSPREAWHITAERLRGASTGFVTNAEKFRAELGWREFGAHVLANFPRTAEDPLRIEFRKFPWRKNATELRAWQRGQTGYPFVDAGMRQLYHTGWMHNRVRMVVASFLVKHLCMDWMHGARWFWDTLVDADLASNTLGWQWAGGCGADAAPYFRIFNPITQGERFDPSGEYVKRWVPELASIPQKFVHSPWTAPPLTLSMCGVTLGKDYPRPIVDHVEARKAALAALGAISAKVGPVD